MIFGVCRLHLWDIVLLYGPRIRMMIRMDQHVVLEGEW